MDGWMAWFRMKLRIIDKCFGSRSIRWRSRKRWNWIQVFEYSSSFLQCCSTNFNSVPPNIKYNMVLHSFKYIPIIKFSLLGGLVLVEFWAEEIIFFLWWNERYCILISFLRFHGLLSCRESLLEPLSEARHSALASDNILDIVFLRLPPLSSSFDENIVFFLLFQTWSVLFFQWPIQWMPIQAICQLSDWCHLNMFNILFHQQQQQLFFRASR